MKKIDLMAKDATKMFMVKKLLGKGLKIEEIENELSIKDLFSYMQYNASEFSNFKFKKENEVM
ncbi:hypothetical protein [Fusobacterium varium]|jgi:hypothetical protein|uniref:hypothetical protein n=1 Tax=Fusobacterium varium TaxID=856 RepID=UPI002055AC17|nr:hypothetical protein [Fusobacterium varium]DAE89492.1 MAG TPA: hypothetical protein [Caudoviricetes sp.]